MAVRIKGVTWHDALRSERQRKLRHLWVLIDNLEMKNEIWRPFVQVEVKASCARLCHQVEVRPA